MFKTSRRGFLVGCSSAIAAMAGSQMNRVVFGSPEAEPNQNIMVVIFLRGGCDALSVITPMGGADRGHYEAARDLVNEGFNVVFFCTTGSEIHQKLTKVYRIPPTI